MAFFSNLGRFFQLYMPTPITRRLFYALWIVFALQALVPITTGLFFLWPPAVEGGQVWRLLTFGMLHGGIGHALFNSLVLLFFGSLVEGRIGAKSYAWLIVLSVLAGGVTHQAMHWGEQVAALGFSGACFGIMAAVLFLAPAAKVYLYGLLPLPIAVLVPVMILLEIVFIIGGTTTGISHWGHLMGAFVGIGMMVWRLWRGRGRGGRGGGGGGRRLSMGHPGRSKNASDLYDDPHWKLDQ